MFEKKINEEINEMNNEEMNEKKDVGATQEKKENVIVKTLKSKAFWKGVAMSAAFIGVGVIGTLIAIGATEQRDANVTLIPTDDSPSTDSLQEVVSDVVENLAVEQND